MEGRVGESSCACHIEGGRLPGPHSKFKNYYFKFQRARSEFKTRPRAMLECESTCCFGNNSIYCGDDTVIPKGSVKWPLNHIIFPVYNALLFSCWAVVIFTIWNIGGFSYLVGYKNQPIKALLLICYSWSI